VSEQRPQRLARTNLGATVAFQDVLDAMQDGFVIQDASGSICDFNHSALEILGLTEDQLLGRTSMDPSWSTVREDLTPFPGEEHPAMVALTTGKSQSNVMMAVSRPNGEVRWIRINANPMTGTATVNTPLQGIPAERYVIVLFADVTEMVSAKSQLDEYFRASVDLICIAHADGRFKRVNCSFYRLLGYGQEDLFEQKFMDFIHPDDVIVARQGMERLFVEHLVYDIKCRFRMKSGGYKRISWSCQLHSKSGNLYASGRDITELQRTEDSLRRLMGQLNESAIVAFTDYRGVITEVNDNFCQISGYSRDELIGKTHKVVNSGEHSREFFGAMWSTVRSG
jgi:PAS domain S-box-containing protein